MGALQTQAVELHNIQCLGEEILASCHPDSIITLKSWISVTKTRYEEVRAFIPPPLPKKSMVSTVIRFIMSNVVAIRRVKYYERLWQLVNW